MKVRLFIVAGLALACADPGQKDLSTEFSETPFRYLRGVQVGMTAQRLHAVRPAARYAPYLGLQERLPGYIVSYQFAMSIADSSQTDVPSNDRLEGVFITEMFDSMEKAEASWREGVARVASSHRAPTSCESFPAGGMQARWTGGGLVLAIGAFPQERIAPSITNRVIYAISPVEAMKQPAGATKVACPN